MQLWSKPHPLLTLMVVGELLGIVSNFLFPKRTAGPKRMIHSPVEQWLGEKGGSLGHSRGLRMITVLQPTNQPAVQCAQDAKNRSRAGQRGMIASILAQ